MTYGIGINIDRGMVFVSDSRTNAGVDQISTFSKMHRFLGDGERYFVLLSAGNLATTQAVVTEIKRHLEDRAPASLKTAANMSAAAEYVGRVSIEQRNKHAAQGDADFRPEVTFILGGEMAGRPPGLFLIYPEGNYIRASAETPYFQIGELKYGKPILDRIISAATPLEDAALCALVSMDSTMRSNATVGAPIELAVYETGRLQEGRHIVLHEHDSYLLKMRAAWQRSLRAAFNDLPRLPPLRPPVRLVDEQT